MKKIIAIIFVLLLLSFTCISIFISSRISFGKVVYINANKNIAGRYISDESNWGKWWPSDTQHTLSSKRKNNEISYSYKNYRYIISHKALEGSSILIMHDADTINSFLHTIALNNDRVAVEWKGQLNETYNPFKKIRNYLLATEVKKNITEIVQSAKSFLENREQVYGLNISQQQVKDTLLISTRFSTNNYPTTAEIYNLIKSLREYIFSKGATETNSPMLNITKDSIFNTMVAIPINRVIPPTTTFLLKKMVPGKILVADVKGGTFSADKAMKQLTIYMDDNHLQSPAIPFQSLVTDRLNEADTTKWLTKIYYPVY